MELGTGQEPVKEESLADTQGHRSILGTSARNSQGIEYKS